MTEEYKQTLIDEVLGTVRRDSNVSPEYVSQLEAYAIKMEKQRNGWRVIAIVWFVTAILTVVAQHS